MVKPSAFMVAQAFGFKDEQCTEYKQRCQDSKVWMRESWPEMIPRPGELQKESTRWEDGVDEFIRWNPQLFRLSNFPASSDGTKKKKTYAHYHLTIVAKRIRLAEQQQPSLSNSRKRKRDISKSALDNFGTKKPPSQSRFTNITSSNASFKNCIIVYREPGPPVVCQMAKWEEVQQYEDLLTWLCEKSGLQYAGFTVAAQIVTRDAQTAEATGAIVGDEVTIGIGDQSSWKTALEIAEVNAGPAGLKFVRVIVTKNEPAQTTPTSTALFNKPRLVPVKLLEFDESEIEELDIESEELKEEPVGKDNSSLRALNDIDPNRDGQGLVDDTAGNGELQLR